MKKIRFPFLFLVIIILNIGDSIGIQNQRKRIKRKFLAGNLNSRKTYFNNAKKYHKRRSDDFTNPKLGKKAIAKEKVKLKSTSVKGIIGEYCFHDDDCKSNIKFPVKDDYIEGSLKCKAINRHLPKCCRQFGQPCTRNEDCCGDFECKKDIHLLKYLENLFENHNNELKDQDCNKFNAKLIKTFQENVCTLS